MLIGVPEGTLSIQRHVHHGTGTWKKGIGGSEEAMGDSSAEDTGCDYGI